MLYPTTFNTVNNTSIEGKLADSLFLELKRRNVFKVGLGYLVLAWVVIQVTDSAVPALHLPDWVNSVVFYFGLVGFPFVLFFSWVFELTPDGVMRQSEIDKEKSITFQTGRKLDYVIITLLVIGLSYFFWESRFASSTDIASPTLTPALKLQDNSNQPVSIAVLPFVDMSPESDQEYFSDGMSEEILNGLVKLPNIKVAGRTSSFAYKGKNTDLREIGKALNVNTILEGSVRKSGLQLRITAQLINAEDGYHLWSETYDRKLTDVFVIQDEITTAIITALKVHLTAEDSDTKKAVTTIEGYTAYMKGRHQLRKRTTETLQLAIQYFQQAISQDPQYAPALSGHARALSLISIYSNLKVPSKQTIIDAEASALAALELDKNNSEAYSVLGYIRFFYDFNWQQGGEYSKKSLMLNPNDSEAYNFLGDFYRASLNIDLAFQMESKALSLDPLFWVNNNELAQVYTLKKDWQNVIKYCQKSIALFKQDLLCHMMMIDSYFAMKQEDKATLFYQEIIADKHFTGSVSAQLQIDILYNIKLNKIDKARSSLITLEEMLINQEAPVTRAIYFYTLLHDYEKVNFWIKYAIEINDLDLIYYGNLLFPEEYPENSLVRKTLDTEKFKSLFTLWRKNLAKYTARRSK